MRLVIDTNVLVSALLSRSGVPARLLERFLAGAGHELLCDVRVLDEYRDVLGRPEFSFGAAAVADLLEAVEAVALVVDAPPLAVRLPDADDLPFLEVAAAGRAYALVTGNVRHFVPVQGSHPVRVVSPREALELIAAG
jgi:uncharacterized protein